MVTFFENRHRNFVEMKFFASWIIEIDNNPTFYFAIKEKEMKYYPHRDLDKVSPRFSSKFYQ